MRAAIKTAIFLLCASASLVSDVEASCASNCLVFSKLNTSDPTSYCVQGAIQYAQAVSCMAVCTQNDSEANSVLLATKDAIDSFCKNADSNCSSVTNAFISQTQCFTPYEGGLTNLLKNILASYNTGAVPTQDCKYLFWGRFCQSFTSKCSFNIALDKQLIANNSQIVLGLACCGSESVDTLSPLLVKTDTCSDSMYSSIEQNCSVAAGIAQAKSSDDICQLMQSQANCISSLAGTCTAALQRYLLPRLDTYSIANMYLGCTVQINGFRVQPPAQSACSYSTQINQCFYALTMQNAMDFTRLKPLFNMDLPIGQFCQNYSALAQAVQACATAFLSCPIPQARLFVTPVALDDLYAISMGVFPLNQWGMRSIFRWLQSLNGVCPKVAWTNAIASYDALAPPTTTATKNMHLTPPLSSTPNSGQNGQGQNNQGQNNQG